MNFAQLRQFFVLLLTSYHIAASLLWNKSVYFWHNRQEAVSGALDVLQKGCKRSVLRHLLETFIFCIYAGMIPTKLRGMFGVSEQSMEVVLDFNKDIGLSLGQSRDSLIFNDLVNSTSSTNPEDSEYAFNEMVKMMERMDPLQNQDSIIAAYSVITSWTDLKHGFETRYSCLLDEIPFLIELSAQIPRLKQSRIALTKFLAKCLDSPDFRRQAVTAICVLLERRQMPEDILRMEIIPRMFSLAVADELGPQEEQRLEMATALTRIITSEVLDRRWMFENFLSQYSRLLGDSMFHIRKAALSVFAELAKMYGERFTELFLVPHIIALSDDTSWSVRKCVCEVFVEVARHTRRHIRAQVLAPRFVRLLRDSSRWVCYAGFQELGPFISTFADSSVTGLCILDGQVCCSTAEGLETSLEMDTSPVPDSLYNQLPPGIWLPLEACSSEPSTAESDSVTQLRDLYKQTHRRSSTQSAPPVVVDDESTIVSVAAKCSSYENLADSELYGGDDDDDSMELELDTTVVDEQHTRDAPTETQKDDLSPMTYWSAGFDTFNIDDDELLAFGNTSTPPSAIRFLERRFDVLYISPEKTSPAASPSGSALVSPCRSRASSDASTASPRSNNDRLRTNSSELDADIFPDCRGIDDSDEELLEKMNNATDDSLVPQDLIDTFMSMVSSSCGLDADINRYCAFNFPAVAYTLGRESWPVLKDTYSRLVADDQWRVRVSLASSLHEMSRIIGETFTAQDLLPVYNAFREDVPEVRVCLLKHLYEFCQCLTTESRIQVIQTLPQFMSFDSGALSNNWRFRLEFANQCLRLCELCEINELNRTMSAIALTLSNDKVAAVRFEAVKLVAYILRQLVQAEWQAIQQNADSDSNNSTLAEIFVNDIVNGFAKSQKWIRRQTFTAMCQLIIEHETLTSEQFRFFLLPHLITMATDRVPNVRVTVISALSLLNKEEKPAPLFGEITTSVGEILHRLLGDSDMDVAREARRACGASVDCELIDIRGRAERQAHRLTQLIEDRCGDLRDVVDMSFCSTTSTSSA